MACRCDSQGISEMMPGKTACHESVRVLHVLRWAALSRELRELTI